MVLVPGAAGRLPSVPMNACRKRLSPAWAEFRANRVSDRYQAGLRDIGIRNPENTRSLFLIEQMDGRPGRAKSARTRGKHEVPGGWRDRAPHGGLDGISLILDTAGETGDD